MAAPTEAQRIAHQAAVVFEQWLVEMLEASEYGTVGFEVTIHGLQPFKRVERKGVTLKMRRGVASVIEKVTT